MLVDTKPLRANLCLHILNLDLILVLILVWQFQVECKTTTFNTNSIQTYINIYIYLLLYKRFFYWLSIVGDGGYTPSPILLTPAANAEEETPEAEYTSEHCRTRCKVEQLFGILTNVCISRQKTLPYNPEKAAKMINACCILHNFRRSYG